MSGEERSELVTATPIVKNEDIREPVNLTQAATDFVMKTMESFDTQGSAMMERWTQEHAQINRVIESLCDTAGLGDSSPEGTPDRGMPVMEAMSQVLKTRVEHNSVLQKFLDSRIKFIAALKSAQAVTVNIDNKENKTGDAELQAMLNNAPAANYDEDEE